MFKRVRILENELSNLKTDFYKLKESVGALRFCNECGEPYKARYDRTRYFHPREIVHCKACDSIIEKRKEAAKIAKNCPDEVIKLGNKKQCKEVEV